MKHSVASGSAFAVPVTNDEKLRAESMRARFSNMLVNLAALEKFLNVFIEHSNDLPEGTSLSTIASLITKYENKLRTKANKVLYEIGDCLDNYGAGFVDNKLDNVKDLIIEAVTDMRNSIIELIKELSNPSDAQFLQRVKEKFTLLQQHIRHINIIVKNDLFKHIDQNILGKVRVGSQAFPLVIRG
jgi:deoxyhypusine synthase